MVYLHAIPRGVDPDAADRQGAAHRCMQVVGEHRDGPAMAVQISFHAVPAVPGRHLDQAVVEFAYSRGRRVRRVGDKQFTVGDGLSVTGMTRTA